MFGKVLGMYRAVWIHPEITPTLSAFVGISVYLLNSDDPPTGWFGNLNYGKKNSLSYKGGSPEKAFFSAVEIPFCF